MRPPPRGRPARHATRDVAATRARLVEAARELFAERGFDDVTVRDICREAHVNLALVNYHFGDKQGLYSEVMNQAIESVREFNELAAAAPAGSSPEDRIRHFVRVMLHRILEQSDRGAWVHKLAQQEFNRPTAESNRFIELAIAPRLRYLASVAAELLGVPWTDSRVMHCVASVHGLCLVYGRMAVAPERFKLAMPDLVPDEPFDIEKAVEHVTAFSLAGIAAIRSGQAAGS
jgi:AcrR family transcriptional regulator